MSSFWGVEVKPGKPHTLTYSDSYGRLRLTQATLGNEVGKVGKGAVGKKCVVQCSVENKDPVFLCVLVSEQSETCHLELEFEEEQVTFSVIGPRSVHLAGYYIADAYEEDMGDGDAGSDSLQGSDDDGLFETDDDDNMVMIDQMTTDSEDDDSDYDSETDDEETAYNQCRGKSSVVIEEIQEDDKPAVGDTQKGSNKKKSSENDDTSQLQLVVRTPPAESLESEDEDGFPVSFSESKKSSESVSKKNRNLNKEKGSEDRKRKSGAVSDNRDSSGEVKAENDGASKKKKRVKDKSTAVDTEKVNNEEKEIKQQDSPANPVSAKQRKKKNKNISASEAEQAAKKQDIHKDGEETAQEANKKNKKKKTQDTNKSENQAPAGLMESENKKEPLQTRTFGNGMIIQEVEMGKPDGKKAAHGKKVSVRYIGKLTNGKIFDSNVGGRPFEFRLGVGEVIKGWDIGVNGMRIGDKRRLTIPPSMGYGGKRVGSIPQNSTLIFDVELVNVR